MNFQERIKNLGLDEEQTEAVNALFTEVTTNHDKVVNDLKLDNALNMSFKDYRAKDNRLVKSLLDLSGISLDESGKLTGLDEQIKGIKESHAYLFEEDKPLKPKFKGFQPGISSGIPSIDDLKSDEWDNTPLTYFK
nr:MAG TPA: minor structural protein [Caudoviricetes sp.]